MQQFNCEICGKCCTPLQLSLYPWEREFFENILDYPYKISIIPQVWIQLNNYEIHSNFMVNGEGPCPFLKGNKCSIHLNKPIACKAFPMKYDITRLHDFPALKKYILASLGSNICAGKWGKSAPSSITLVGRQKMIEFGDYFPKEVQEWAAVNARLNAIENLGTEGLIYLGGINLDIDFAPLIGKITIIDLFQYLIEERVLSDNFINNLKTIPASKLIPYLDKAYHGLQENWVAYFGPKGFSYKYNKKNRKI